MFPQWMTLQQPLVLVSTHITRFPTMPLYCNHVVEGVPGTDHLLAIQSSPCGTAITFRIFPTCNICTTFWNFKILQVIFVRNVCADFARMPALVQECLFATTR